MVSTFKGLPRRLSGKKNLLANAGDVGSILGSGRLPGEGNGNPLQYFRLENPIGRGAWWAAVHGVMESDMTEHAHMHHDGRVEHLSQRLSGL